MTEGDTPDVGALSEEALRLLQAVQEWARDAASTAGTGGGEGLLHDINEHIATGGDSCRYCPVCRVIARVRTASPEVRQHLTVAASSLLQALAGVLTAPSAGSRSDNVSVEHIDLDGDNWEDED